MPFPVLVVHLTINLLVVLAYASGLWMNWPERLYQKTKDVRLFWCWMPSLKLPETEQNCVWSIRALCVVMIVATIAGAILRIIFYR